MIGRTSMKARLGIATAVLVGGGAIGVATVATTSHGTATTAQSAGYSLNFGHTISEQQALSSALGTWATSQQKSLSTLAQMAPMRTFSQTWHRNTLFAVQRGVVLLATKKFLLVKSANGALHLWWLEGTKFQNVSSTTTGMSALTGNSTATKQAMVNNNMAPAATVMAGSTTAVSQLAASVAKQTTVTVQTGTTTVTVTTTQSTATVTQATHTTTGMATTTTKQSMFSSIKHVARGDLVLVAGLRTHGSLVAKLVLFAAPTTVKPTPSASITTTPTSTSTVGTTPTAVPTVTSAPPTMSGTHS
jgi:hypothetical protein